MKHLLSPREVAAAIGVSESTLKRWTDDGLITATRTAGGHRRIPVNEAIRFVRETQARIVNPTILGLSEISGLEEMPLAGTAERTEQMHRALLEGEAARVRGLVTSFFLDGMPVTELCDDILTAAMSRIGEIWREKEEGIFIEHRATDLCLQSLNHLQGLIELPKDAAVAVGGGPPKDPYLLGTLMAATCLADAGIRAINLGPDTPTESILHAVDHAGASLAWLSISAPATSGLSEQIGRLADGLVAHDACLVVGGRHVNRSELSLRSNVHVGRNMQELVAYARGVIAARSSSTGGDRGADAAAPDTVAGDTIMGSDGAGI
jgi:excisionase family DNA binding protein